MSSKLDNWISVEEFRERTEWMFHPIGELSGHEIENMVFDHVKGSCEELGIQIKNILLFGSRARGLEHEDSDIDILLEYEGDLKEYVVFNALNQMEDPFEIEKVRVDITPVREEESGAISCILTDAEEYLKKKKTRPNKPLTNYDLFQNVDCLLNDKFNDILDYSLGPSGSEVVPLTHTNYELRSHLDFGGSEGIYLDLSMEDCNSKEVIKLGTYKTLYESEEGMVAMGSLLGSFVFAFRKVTRELYDTFDRKGYRIYVYYSPLRSDCYYSCLDWGNALMKAGELARKGKKKVVIIDNETKRTKKVLWVRPDTIERDRAVSNGASDGERERDGCTSASTASDYFPSNS